MTDSYSPKDYWEQRLNQSFDLKGVGHKHFSQRYNAWLYRRKARCLDAALAGIAVKGKQVLDIGCGTGFFVHSYIERGATVRGIDITEVSVSELRKRYPGEFVRQDISAADYEPAGQFDIANMWDVIYHIVDPDSYERALQNVARSLRPGGHFLFTDWLGADADIRVAGHVQARCLATHRSRLNAHGLELVAQFPLYRLMNKRRLGGLDNILAPLYYLLDDRTKRIARNNISLSVWRKN